MRRQPLLRSNTNLRRPGAAALSLQEVCGWINAKATVPVWAKMTPNVTDITWPARTALTAGAESHAPSQPPAHHHRCMAAGCTVAGAW